MPAMGIFRLAFGLPGEGANQSDADAVRISASGVDDEQPKIGGDQFVAAAAGVELPAQRAELLD